jgi:uncharacterized protein
MNKAVSSNPLIGHGWLRVLLFVIPLAGLVIFIGRFGHAGAISGQLQPGFYDLVFFIASVILTYIFRRWIDRKSFASLGLLVNGYLRDAIAGGMLAILMVCICSLILRWTGHLRWTDIIFDPRSLFLMLGSTALAAFGEELVFRGYILSNLMLSFNKWLALLISAILFMTFHMPWPFNFIPLLNILIIGLILGLNYIYTRNLWFSVCFHIGWIFLEGPVLGFSGVGTKQSLLQFDIQGGDNITGGTVGLEGSFVFTIISLMSLIVLYLFLQRKTNLQSRPIPGRI